MTVPAADIEWARRAMQEGRSMAYIASVLETSEKKVRTAMTGPEMAGRRDDGENPVRKATSAHPFRPQKPTEGWYEEIENSETIFPMAAPTHWQPLPKPPAMTEPTPEQMRCGHALYGPPALCACGTCDVADYCQTCGGTGDADNAAEDECRNCCGTGRTKSENRDAAQ